MGKSFAARQGRRTACGAYGHNAPSLHRCSAGVKIENAGGVLVDSEHEGSVGQIPLHDRKAPLTQIAETGVVRPTLVVVVVGDDRRPNPRRRR